MKIKNISKGDVSFYDITGEPVMRPGDIVDLPETEEVIKSYLSGHLRKCIDGGIIAVISVPTVIISPTPKVKYTDWQESVKSRIGTPPEAPVTGDRHLITIGTGLWTGHNDEITEWKDNFWEMTPPNPGFTVYVEDENQIYRFDGHTWKIWTGGVTDHSQLTGVLPYQHHSHNNKLVLDAVEESLTAALKAAYDNAVAKTHEHSNKSVLDGIQESLTTELKAAYDNAVVKIHEHSNKTTLDDITAAFTTVLKNKLDGIESGAVSLATMKADADISDALSKRHSHNNKLVLDLIQEALTTVLKNKLDGIESGAVSLGTVKTDVDIADAIAKKHTKTTSVTELTDHNKAVHDALGINAAELQGSSPGLNDGDIAKLPVATEGQVLRRGATKWEPGIGGAGVTKFTELTDVPSSYTGQAGKAVKVKSDASGLEFSEVAGGGVSEEHLADLNAHSIQRPHF